MRLALLLAVGLIAALGTGTASAALPPKGTTFTFHDHHARGDQWHVEVVVSPKRRDLAKLVVFYSEKCATTEAQTNVPISPEGILYADGKVGNGRAWAVYAQFTEPKTLVGAGRATGPKCDTGALAFPNAITGDGLGGDVHGPMYPDFSSATRAQRAQAQRLHRRVNRRWSGVSFAQAKRLGFHRLSRFKTRKPGIFHLYNSAYENDSRIFDYKRPESLVFYRERSGPPVLVGPMFRVPPAPRPRFAGPIPLYHSHGTGAPTSQMTHVWLVDSPRMAWANCLPVSPLEAYNPRFDFLPKGQIGQHAAVCPAPTQPTQGQP